MSIIKTHNGWVQLEPEDYTLAQDVHEFITIEQARKENAQRINKFLTFFDKYMSPDVPKSEKVWPFEAFNTPIPPNISNPSPKYVFPYEGYKGPVRDLDLGIKRRD